MAVVRYRDKNGNIVPLRVIQGENGNQMFVRFSAYADGTDMSEAWDSERTYMGIAFGVSAPTQKEGYMWLKLGRDSFGRYAEADSEAKYLFYIGNGTDEDHRSNAVTVDENGNAWFSGDVTFGEDLYSPREEILAEKTEREKQIAETKASLNKARELGDDLLGGRIDVVEADLASHKEHAIKMATGSYVGTGSAQTLSFSFVPKIVFMQTKYSYISGDYTYTHVHHYIYNSDNGNDLMLCMGDSSGGGISTSAFMKSINVSKSTDGKSLTLHRDASHEGATYYYTAIG